MKDPEKARSLYGKEEKEFYMPVYFSKPARQNQVFIKWHRLVPTTYIISSRWKNKVFGKKRHGRSYNNFEL